MLSPSRQSFLSTCCWGCGEGTHPRDLLLLRVSELKVGTNRLCVPHANQSSRDLPAGEWRDFIWRSPLGTAGSLALPPSFWEAAAYCFRGNNNRARLSMSDASCMPLGDPSKIHSFLGKCSFDHPFLPQRNLRGASTDKVNSQRSYWITLSQLLMFSQKTSIVLSQLHWLRDLFSASSPLLQRYISIPTPCPSFQPFGLSPFPPTIKSKPAVGRLAAPSCPLLQLGKAASICDLSNTNTPPSSEFRNNQPQNADLKWC